MTGNQLVRKFVLQDHSDWVRFVTFMRANLPEMVKQGRAMQAVVSEYKMTRSNEQNAAYWAGILTPMEEQAFIGGTRYKAEIWHEQCKELFLPETCAKGMDKWQYLPSGTRRLMMGTGDLNHAEMILYMAQCSAYAANELGVMLPANPRDL